MPSDSDTEQTTLWLFLTALCVGGTARTLVDLANNLDDEYDVTVWTIFATTPLESDLRDDIPVRSLTTHGKVENDSVTGVTNPVAYVTVPLRFCYAVYTERPEILQSFLFFDNVVARIAGVVSETTTVITGVRAVPNDPSTVRATVDRLTMGLSDHVVSNSDDGKALAVDRGADPEAVSVIRNGRDISLYRTAEPTTVESELDIGESELVVGTVGRLLERKGHFELVTAWANLQARDVDARLLFVGEGQDGAAIRDHARELGCADSIEFLGTRHDIPELLAAMDVFAFPSYFEGLPGAVVEAMAAGLPIVATPADGTASLIDNYRTGLFVPVRAVDDLTWALVRLLETPTLRASLGDAAHQRASEAFGIDSMVGEFEELYRELESA